VGIEYGILGPLQVRRDGQPVVLAGDRQRVLLGRLLVADGRAVPIDVLIDDLWSGSPPPRADSTLQSHISALRRTIGSQPIGRLGRSYCLTLARDQLDVWCAEEDLAAARLRLGSGDHAEAIEVVEQALGRWRGSPLADVASHAWAAPEMARCEELRVQCLEAWLDAHLRAGRSDAVVAQAEAAVAEYPLRERLWAQLMMGLYRSGRQADALRAYQRLRLQLAEQLGLNPSPELVALERAILQHDPSLNALPPQSGSESVKDHVRPAGGAAWPVAIEAGGTGAGEGAGRPGPMSETRSSVTTPGGEEDTAPPPPRTPHAAATRPPKRWRPSIVVPVVVMLLAGGALLAGPLSGSDAGPSDAPSLSSDGGPTATERDPDAPPVEVTGPQVVASGTALNGRAWSLEARRTPEGQICTRLSIDGIPFSENCDSPPQGTSFGPVRVRGMTQPELAYLSWTIVSEQTARAEATTLDGDDAGPPPLLTEPTFGARYIVSYAPRLVPIRLTAYDRVGAVIGETEVPPIRPPSAR